MAFPPGFLDELRARVSLSDIVGRKVSLKRRSGSEYAGLCPFHNEKTPSFTVNDKKGFFHCFGCGEHGDAIGFVMKTEGLGFPDAVEKLAREANLPVPRATPQERERAERASTLQQVVEMAANWFQKQLRLPVGRQGLDYLRGRGLSDATLDDFRLGFAPDSRDGLLAALKREGVPVDKIVEAGLAIQPEERGRDAYDRFRGRVMFTINDRRGRAIGFVFQYHYLLPEFTALENVMMPVLAARGRPDAEMRINAADLLDKVGLTPWRDHRANDISGGQQQRVAVARALAMKPVLVLADEPTGNLDTKAADGVFDLMRSVNETTQTTFLIVTHDPRLAQRCDRILELVDGRIVSDRPNANVVRRSA